MGLSGSRLVGEAEPVGVASVAGAPSVDVDGPTSKSNGRAAPPPPTLDASDGCCPCAAAQKLRRGRAIPEQSAQRAGQQRLATHHAPDCRPVRCTPSSRGGWAAPAESCSWQRWCGQKRCSAQLSGAGAGDQMA
jgi:hypothetical protein